MLIAPGVYEIAQSLAESQNEKHHRVGAHGNRRIALLDARIRAFGHANALRHHLDGEPALAAGAGQIDAEFGQRTPDSGRKQVVNGRSHNNVR